MAGQLARINLTSGKVFVTEAADSENVIGGRGYGVQVIINEVDRDSDPLSEGNKLVFAPGALTGSAVPGSSRTALITRNVLNNGISYSSGGGNFGPALMGCGYSALIIEGRAEKPVYLMIDRGRVELKDAGFLWGKSTWDTVDAIREKESDQNFEVASIGPAGENLVKISCVIIDKAHALAWGGSGAVMGSKRLKAIAVKGGLETAAPADPESFSKAVKHYNWLLKSSSASAALREGGTHGMAGVGGWSGQVPTAVRNLQEEYWAPASAARISEPAFRPYETSRTRCFNCPLYCLHKYQLEHEGELLKCEGMHANSVRGFGSNWDVDSPYAVLKAHALCNMLGLDIDGVAAVIAWATECFERNLLSEKDTGGLRLAWGEHKAMLQMIQDIATRKGFGDQLAEGVYRAAEAFDGTADYAMHIKKVGLNEQGVRSHKAWAFGMAVSTRGGGHLSGSPQTENRQIPAFVGEWIFGLPGAGKPGSVQGKGRLVAWYEVYKALIDSLGICYFTAGWYELSLANPDLLAELYSAFSGTEVSSEELWTRGRLIVNLEKAFNTVNAGFGRADDRLPGRIMKEPLTVGPYHGEVFSEQQLDQLLDEYYTVHRWDPRTGRQIPANLKKDGLGEVAKYLGEV